MTVSENDELDRADMARLQAGQDRALDELMARHAERLFLYLVRVLQNETEAAEAAEESFVRIYQHRARYRSTNKFTTWLYAIATNLARDLQRHRARHPNVSLEAEHGEASQSFRETLPETRPNPVEQLESNERALAVRKAVAALPEDLRTPLVLAEYEEKSYAEIGAILDCSPKAVEMRLYRARHELRERLAGWL